MSDIQKTLELVRARLNEALRNALPRDEDWVVLSNLVDPEGRHYEGTKDKLVMFLANIQHETTISTYTRTQPAEGDRYAVVAPPLYVDLFLLFMANFYDRNYAEGLGLISRTIAFFQQNPWFTPDSLPGLAPEITKLQFEFNNLEMTELNYLMGLAGVKYLPSVYYKVRLLPFASDALLAEVPGVSGLRTPGEPDASTTAAPRRSLGAASESETPAAASAPGRPAGARLTRKPGLPR
jgi:Pvc16 N-terminal domain